MNRYISFLLFNFIISLPLHSQSIIEGKVLNLADKNPISFVNIGIVNSSVGTISNEDGSFYMRIPEKYSDDTVIFSALGYGKMYIPISELSVEDFYTIYLKESPRELNTVTIIGDTWKGKKYRFGNDRIDGSCLYADTIMAGSAMALLIQTNTAKNRNQFDYPLFLNNVHLMIADNTFDEFKVRTRIYELDTATGLPGKDILNESVIKNSTLENGRLDIDLSKYNIEINGDFYLGFEWILDKNDRKNLYQQYEGFKKAHPDKVVTNYVYIDGERIPYLNYQGNVYAGPSFGMSVSKNSLKNNMCFYRLNSFGKWYRSPSVIAAGVTLNDQPYPVNGSKFVSENNDEEGIEALLPYYKIERRSLATKNEEFVWELNPEDTGFFAQKMKDAIIIEVRRLVNKLSFYAKNNSIYPYQLEMNFSKIINLRPIISNEFYIVYPGLNKLLEFNVEDPSIDNFHYELFTREIIGDPDKLPNLNYPYLIPIGIHNTVKIDTTDLNDEHNLFSEFTLRPNDTIFAMRKGIVAATPALERNVDRVSGSETLEILHSDGTIMVYSNLNPQKPFIKKGETVYPGQPVGIVGSTGSVKVELFKISRTGRLERLNMLYYMVEDHKAVHYKLLNGCAVNYPDSIIVKEMDDQQVERYKKHTLY